MTEATCVVEVGVSLPRRISGKVILVISGPGRMMYQSLEPEPEGAICCKRSMPQDDYSTPHDAGASMGHWLESNIQGRLQLSSRRWCQYGALVGIEHTRTTTALLTTLVPVWGTGWN